MKKHITWKWKRTACAVLALAMVMSVPGGAALAEGSSSEANKKSGNGIKKEETVYVNLDPTGKQEDITVSDWLHSDAVVGQIQDKSDLTDIQNVKSDEKPVQSGNNLIWNISSSSAANSKAGTDLYYQGKTTKKPPLEVKVNYYLNDKELTANQIAGKSGKVKIKITLKNTDAKDVLVKGKIVRMYTPMAAVAAVTLPTDTFQNVQADHGKVLSDGNNQAVTFVTVPGLKESLGLDTSDIKDLRDIDIPESFNITADATNFKLDSIAVVAVPKLSDTSINKNSTDVTDLQDQIKRLSNVKKSMDQADPQKQTQSLFQDYNKTARARLLVNDVFLFYGMDKALLDILPDYVNADNIKLYDRVTTDLDDIDADYVMDNHTIRTLGDRITSDNVYKGKSLLKDYDQIQTFNMSELDDMIEMLDSYDDLRPLVNDSGKLVKDVTTTSPSALKVLNGLTGYSSDVMQIAESATKLTSGVTLSDEDINTMVGGALDALAAKKTTEAAVQYESMVGQDGSIQPQNRRTVIGILMQAQAATTDAAQKAQLSQLIQLIQLKGTVGPYRDTVVGILDQAVQAGVEKQINSIKEQIPALMTSVKSLQTRMAQDGIDEASLSSAMAYTKRYVIPDVKNVISDAQKNESMLIHMSLLASDEDEIKYLDNWAKKIRNMKGDLDSNTDNVELLRDLTNLYDDPKMKHALDKMPTLWDDFDDVRPIAESLRDRLKEPALNRSLHNSPQMITDVLKIKNDLNNNHNIIDIFNLTVQPKSVSAMDQAFDMLDDYDKKGYQKKLDSVNDILDRKDAYADLADSYNIFTEAQDGTDTQVKFIMKTDEVKVPEVPAAAPKVEKKQGFFDKVGSFFSEMGRKIASIF